MIILEEPMNISIVVAGESGVGKSTIANALVGMDVSKSNDDVVSVTQEVKTIVAAKNGVRVFITDVPGLGDLGMKDDDILQEASEHSEEIDLFLFCIKMTKRLCRHHIEEIEAVTMIFGKDIWKKGLFVLTFANEIKETKNFTSKLHDWKSEIRKRIKNVINMEVADKIPIVPTGFKEPELPDRPSWLSELWIQGVRRMGFKARYYMVVLSMERFGEEIVVKKEMCGNEEEESLVTCDMAKEHSKCADPKHTPRVGQILDLVFSSVISPKVLVLVGFLALIVLIPAIYYYYKLHIPVFI